MRVQTDGASARAERQDARRQAAVEGARGLNPSCRRKPAVRIGLAYFGAAIPTPTRYEDRVDAFTLLQVAERHAGQFGIAPPLAFAGNHEVKIKLAINAMQCARALSSMPAKASSSRISRGAKG